MNKYYIEQNSSHRCGLNKYADLTPTEFKEKFLMRTERNDPIFFGNSTINSQIKEKPPVLLKGIKVPDSWDWRDHIKLTKVKDQSRCVNLPLIDYYFIFRFSLK